MCAETSKGRRRGVASDMSRVFGQGKANYPSQSRATSVRRLEAHENSNSKKHNVFKPLTLLHSYSSNYKELQQGAEKLQFILLRVSFEKGDESQN